MAQWHMAAVGNGRGAPSSLAALFCIAFCIARASGSLIYLHLLAIGRGNDEDEDKEEAKQTRNQRAVIQRRELSAAGCEEQTLPPLVYAQNSTSRKTEAQHLAEFSLKGRWL
jgi:hypothetical protein